MPQEIYNMYTRQNPAAPVRRWENSAPGEIALWIADMDLGKAPEIQQALMQFALEGSLAYCNVGECVPQAIQQWLQDQHNWQIATDSCVICSDLVSALHAVATIAQRNNAHVISPDIVYPPIRQCAEFNSIPLRTYPIVRTQNTLTIDLDKLKLLAAPKGSILMLCNPHNPGGIMWSPEIIEQIGLIVHKNDWILCSDEIHADLVLKHGKQHNVAAKVLKDTGGKIITLMSPSKTFNIASCAVSYAVIEDTTLRQAFQKAVRGRGALNSFALVATYTAYTCGKPWHQKTILALQKNLANLQAMLKSFAPYVQLIGGEATFLAWIYCQKPINWHEALRKNGLWIHDGTDFGAPRFIRINFATTPDIFEQALAKLRKTFAEQFPHESFYA